MESGRFRLFTFLFFCGFFFGPSVHGEEVDDFQKPPKTVRESAPAVNDLVNWHLKEVADILAKKPFRCEREKIIKALEIAIGGNWTSTVGELQGNLPSRWYDTDPRQQAIEKIVSGAEIFGGTDKDKSATIYRDTPRLINGSCCINRIKVNGIIVGLDKLDHFLGNGGELWIQYDRAKRAKDPLDKMDVLKLNVLQEHAAWGLKDWGVKSYGDISANWAGFKFWEELLDGPNPYYVCKNNKLSLVRKFDIKNYVDESWNEAINCSSYNSKEFADVVKKNMRAAGLKCPMDASICKKLSQKYANSPEEQKAILSPLCLQPNSNFSQIEQPVEGSWDDLVQGAKGLTFKTFWSYLKRQYSNLKYDLGLGTK